ncbi:Proteasome subunit alpha type [Abeliophyllum distichum]|uniref:Proteasome subunit alpha type n=1 Tax=Abeliophyllum distichum TaxID=126358 RepID=A0ABD1P804_9LAMI
MLMPFFNDVVGILGALGFWPLTVYFPVEMYIAQNKIGRWTNRWIGLQMLSMACLFVSVSAAVGSVAGVVLDLKTAITVFSPDGHQSQVQHTLDAVRKGNAGIRGTDTVVIAVGKKTSPKLQESRSVRKIINLDDRIAVACAGLKAVAHFIINKPRIECQSHKLTGHFQLGSPCYWEKQNSIREFQEKNYKETSGQGTVKLATSVLLEETLIWMSNSTV